MYYSGRRKRQAPRILARKRKSTQQQTCRSPRSRRVVQTVEILELLELLILPPRLLNPFSLSGVPLVGRKHNKIKYGLLVTRLAMQYTFFQFSMCCFDSSIVICCDTSESVGRCQLDRMVSVGPITPFGLAGRLFVFAYFYVDVDYI